MNDTGTEMENATLLQELESLRKFKDDTLQKAKLEKKRKKLAMLELLEQHSSATVIQSLFRGKIQRQKKLSSSIDENNKTNTFNYNDNTKNDDIITPKRSTSPLRSKTDNNDENLYPTNNYNNSNNNNNNKILSESKDSSTAILTNKANAGHKLTLTELSEARFALFF